MQLPNLIVITLSLIITLISSTAHAQKLSNIPNIETLNGVALPDTEFYDKNGSPVTLADFKGKPLILNFWASWCIPCVQEMPALISLSQKLSPHNNMELVTVSEDFQGMKTVRKFLEKNKFDIKNPFVDNKNHLMNALNINSIPTTILIDKQGVVRAKISGAIDWHDPAVFDILKNTF